MGSPLDLVVLTPSFPTRRSSDLDAGMRRGGEIARHLDGEPAAGIHTIQQAGDQRLVMIQPVQRGIGVEQIDRLGRPPGRDVSLDEGGLRIRSEEHTSEIQSLMRNSYAVFCVKKKKQTKQD